MIDALLDHQGVRIDYRHLLVPIELLVGDFMLPEATRLHNCVPCGIYRKCWACPGLNGSFDGYNSGDWPHVLLYSFSLDVDYEPGGADTYRAVQRAYQVIAPYALQYGGHLENLLGGKLMIDGRCAVCRTCTAALDPPQPCAYPDKLRSSLESLGFNVIRIAKQLLERPLEWHVDRGADRPRNVPNRISVVHGLLTHADEPADACFESWMSPAASAWIADWRKGA